MVQAATEHTLSGINIAILVTDGFEVAELAGPRLALEQAGASARIISSRHGQVQGFDHGIASEMINTDLSFDEADPQDFDAVLLPGGDLNAQRLRSIPEAQRFVQGMQDYGKPIAAICHGAALLVSAGLVAGRTLTSWPSLRDEIGLAHGNWVDHGVVVDGNLISGCQPADLSDFTEKLMQMLEKRISDSVHGTHDEKLGVGLSS